MIGDEIVKLLENRWLVREDGYKYTAYKTHTFSENKGFRCFQFEFNLDKENLGIVITEKPVRVTISRLCECNNLEDVFEGMPEEAEDFKATMDAEATKILLLENENDIAFPTRMKF